LTLWIVRLILSPIRFFHRFLKLGIFNKIRISHITLLDNMHLCFAFCIYLHFRKWLVYTLLTICLRRSIALIIFNIFFFLFNILLIVVLEIYIDNSWVVILFFLCEFLIQTYFFWVALLIFLLAVAKINVFSFKNQCILNALTLVFKIYWILQVIILIFLFCDWDICFLLQFVIIIFKISKI
jgi:hypothetical protein